MREKRQLWCVLVFAVALTAPADAANAAGIDVQDFTQIKRGSYLTVVGDCAACHTLPGSGHAFAGGRPIETPFGELVAPNITPDPQTGIGAWTDDEFVNALTKGTGRNGTHLYPAMHTPTTLRSPAMTRSPFALISIQCRPCATMCGRITCLFRSTSVPP